MYHVPAQKTEPSYTLEVSLKGLSVPLTSWWSLLITTGAWTRVTTKTLLRLHSKLNIKPHDHLSRQFILLLKRFHQQQPGWSPKQWRLFLSGQSTGFWLVILQPKQKKKKQYMKHMGILVVLLFIYYLCNLHWNIQWVDCFSRELTILCFPASLIQWMLSLYCCFTRSGTLALISSRTVAAMLSVTARSLGSSDVHTQRNGPKPNEKISLGKGIWNEIKNIAHKLIHTSH